MAAKPILYPTNAQEWMDENIREKGPFWAYLGDHVYSGFNGELLGKALRGFRLNPCPDISLDWLADGVRKVLAMTAPKPDTVPDTLLSNREQRDELRRFAARLQAALSEYDSLGRDTKNTLGVVMNDESKAHFNKALKYIQWMSDTALLCSDHIKRDNPKWRSSAKRMLRVRQAWYLSPIYERAFNRQATYSDYSNSPDLGPWPDFFRRIILHAEAEDVKGLRDIVKEARTKHMQTPAEFPEAFIPNLR